MENFLYLFSQMTNPESDSIALNASIMELVSDPTSIFHLVQIAESNNSAILRQSALIYAHKYFEPLLNCDDSDIIMPILEQVTPLQPNLLNLLVNNRSDLLNPLITSVVEDLAILAFRYSTWEEYISTAQQLIQSTDEYELKLGLCLIPIMFDLIDYESENEQLFSYGQIILNAMISNSKEVRIAAIEAFYALIECVEDEEDFANLPTLTDTLATVSNQIITVHQIPDECSKFFDMLGYLFFDHFGCFIEEGQKYCQFVREIASKKEIDIEIRVNSQLLLDMSPLMLEEYYSEPEVAKLYIESTLLLALDAYDHTDDPAYFVFGSTFLDNLSKAIDGYECLDFILECAANLIQMGTLHSQHVALFGLSCVIGNLADAVMDKPDEIVEYIKAGLLADDPNIIKESHDLLIILVTTSASCVSTYLDQFVEILSVNLENPQNLKTLSIVLNTADQTTSHLMELLQRLVALLTTEGYQYKDDIIQCISASIEHSGINEEIYPYVKDPLLSEANTDSSLISDTFQCFGILSQVSPVAFKSQIDEILQLILQSEFNTGVLQAYLSIVKQFTESTANYTSSILQNLLDIFEKQEIEVSPSTQEIEEDNDIDPISTLNRNRAITIQILSYFCPTDERFIRIVLNSLSELSPTLVESSAAALQIALPSLAKANVDPTEFIIKLVSVLTDTETDTPVIEGFHALSDIFSLYNVEYIIPHIEKLAEFLLKSVSGALTIFTQPEYITKAETTVYPAVFTALYRFIDTLGQSFEPYVAHFQPKIYQYVLGKKQTLKGLAVYILTRLAILFNSEDLMLPAVQQCIVGINSRHILFKQYSINSLNMIVKSCSGAIQEQLPDIRANISTIINSYVQGSKENISLFDAASAFWCVSVMHGAWPADESTLDTAKLILDCIPLETTEDNDLTCDFALFALYVAQNNWNIPEQIIKVAIRSFIESESNLRHVSAESMNYLTQVISQSNYQEGEIQSLVGYNQRKFNLVMSHVNSNR